MPKSKVRATNIVQSNETIRVLRKEIKGLQREIKVFQGNQLKIIHKRPSRKSFKTQGFKFQTNNSFSLNFSTLLTYKLKDLDISIHHKISTILGTEAGTEAGTKVDANKILLATDIWHDQKSGGNDARGSFEPDEMKLLINKIVGVKHYIQDEDNCVIKALRIAVKDETIKGKVQKYRIVLTKAFTSQFQGPKSNIFDRCNFVFDNVNLGEDYYSQGIVTPAKYIDTANISYPDLQKHSDVLFGKTTESNIIKKHSREYGFKDDFPFFIEPTKDNMTYSAKLHIADKQPREQLSPRAIRIFRNGIPYNGSLEQIDVTNYVIAKALGDILVFTSCLDVQLHDTNVSNCILVSTDRLIIAHAILHGVSTLQASTKYLDEEGKQELIKVNKKINEKTKTIIQMKSSVTFYTYIGKNLETSVYSNGGFNSIKATFSNLGGIISGIVSLFSVSATLFQRGGANRNDEKEKKYWLAKLIERGTDVIAERYEGIINELRNVSRDRFIKLKKDSSHADDNFKKIFNSIADDLEGYCYLAINHFLKIDLPKTIQGFDTLIESVKRFCPSVISIYLKDGMFNSNIIFLDIFKEDMFSLNDDGSEPINEDIFYAIQMYEIDFKTDIGSDSQSYITQCKLGVDISGNKFEHENTYLKIVLDNFTNIQGTENRIYPDIYNQNYETFDDEATKFITQTRGTNTNKVAMTFNETKNINLSKQLEVLTTLNSFVDFYLTEIANTISAYDFLHLYYVLKHCGKNQYGLDDIVTERLVSELGQYLEYSYSAFFKEKNIDFLQNDSYCKKINSSERVKEQLLVGAFANYLNYQNHGYQINEDLLNETKEELEFKDTPTVNYYIDMMDQMVSLYLSLIYAPFAINIQVSEMEKLKAATAVTVAEGTDVGEGTDVAGGATVDEGATGATGVGVAKAPVISTPNRLAAVVKRLAMLKGQGAPIPTISEGQGAPTPTNSQESTGAKTTGAKSTPSRPVGQVRL